MAHFAEIDNDGTVLRVLVVGDDQEHRGQEFLVDDLGLGGTWVQTSYNNNIRKRFAGAGMSYNTELDAFIPIKCHDEAVLNEETCDWDCTNAEHEIGETNVAE
jgi:hypothetical protein